MRVSILMCLALLLVQTHVAFATPPESVVYPLPYSSLTSRFGYRVSTNSDVKRHHSGVDIGAPLGTEVRAIKGGIVLFAAGFQGYGNLVVIRHRDGVTSHYAHLGRVDVLVGEQVLAGEVLGVVGMTGNTTGPHLHFEIRRDGVAVDPVDEMPWLEVAGMG